MRTKRLCSFADPHSRVLNSAATAVDLHIYSSPPSNQVSQGYISDDHHWLNVFESVHSHPIFGITTTRSKAKAGYLWRHQSVGNLIQRADPVAQLVSDDIFGVTKYTRNGKLGFLSKQLVYLTNRSNNCTKHRVVCAYKQEPVLVNTETTKRLQTDRICDNLSQPPSRQVSNESCTSGNDQYNDSLFTDDAILLTQPTCEEPSLDIRTQHQTTDNLMQTTRPQTPGNCRHNAQIPAVEVPDLRYRSSPTLTAGPMSQYAFLRPHGQFAGNSCSHIVGKSDHFSVQHTAEGSIRCIAESSSKLLALVLKLPLRLGDCNFTLPTQDAWVAFRGDMVTYYYLEEKCFP
jgi:hypothetical protein